MGQAGVLPCLRERSTNKEELMELSERQERIMRAARRGYEAYCGYTGCKSAVTGDPLPIWESLPGAVKNAWFAAAASIFQEMRGEP